MFNADKPAYCVTWCYQGVTLPQITFSLLRRCKIPYIR
nr:MAG TPA: hypothetical protein [Crassvirales sp.]